MEENNLENCPRCSKRVYDAEAIPIEGLRYHKKCFKCTECLHKLDATTGHVHEKQPYCGSCIKRILRAKKPNTYADTSLLPPKDGESGCPRCTGAVYEAEKVVLKSGVYHKRCFTCAKCTRPLDMQSCGRNPDDNEIYCTVCYKVVTAHDRPTAPTETTVIMADEDGCPRCGGKVYEAEKVATHAGMYHKSCFTCISCKRMLDFQNMTLGPDKELYCYSCYSPKFGKKAVTVTLPTNEELIKGEDENEENVCPRCMGKVYDAERQVTKYNNYHKKCFKCIKCKHDISPSDYINGPDKNVYCMHCYTTQFGAKAPVKSEPLDTTRIKGVKDAHDCCPRCGGKVFEAEKMISTSGWAYHRHCFRCSTCTNPLDPTSVCEDDNSNILCRVCYSRINVKPQFLDKALIETWTIQGNADDNGKNVCPRCSGKVYPAEKLSYGGLYAYHKRCFTCRICENHLDTVTASESPDGEVVCRTCYDLYYSVKNANLSGADMLKLLDTTSIVGPDQQDKDGYHDTCPRCKGKVFHAERIVHNKQSYHRRCCTCTKCSKTLNSQNFCLGKDENLYCKSCYARKYGSAGYRGAGTTDWSDVNSIQSMRPVQNIDVAAIKGDSNDMDTCLRCDGKIFENERVPSNKRNWHKKCFNCKSCHRILQTEGPKSQAIDGPDSELYCPMCFKKEYPQSETPLIFSDTDSIAPKEGVLGCPRCSGAVFKAESVIINEQKTYHKRCLTCKKCERALDITILAVGPDNDIYCRVCSHKLSFPSSFVGVKDTTSILGDSGSESSCPRCNGKVFEAEKVSTKHAWYHKQCFTCVKCQTHLDQLGASECSADKSIYCKTCYLKAYGPGGANHFGDKAKMEAIAEEDTDSCVRCKGRVFETEKVLAKSGYFHNYCLNCNECKSNLNASSFYNGLDGEVYCQHCYARKFGHKKQSEYNGWMDVKAIKGAKGEVDTCPRCSGKVFEAERMTTRVGSFHKICFSCKDCKRKLDSVICCEGPDSDIYCQSCYSLNFGTRARSVPRKNRQNKKNGEDQSDLPNLYNHHEDFFVASNIETWVIKGEKDEADTCPKCQGKVFEAEKITTAQGLWYHRNCYRCVDCSRLLDSLSVNDGPDLKLYCKGCYKTRFGPQTRSADAEIKSMDTTALRSEDECRNCPRCGGEVFKAEQIPSNGKVYHIKCASCSGCSKQLNFSSICDGKDGDIYCTLCYSRKFAPSGYRGIGATSWVDLEASANLRNQYEAY